MAFSVNYLHYIGMKPSCYFSGHNVNLLMSLCCIILVAPPCPFHTSHPCNESIAPPCPFHTSHPCNESM